MRKLSLVAAFFAAILGSPVLAAGTIPGISMTQQAAVAEDGSVTWQDSDVVTEAGKSQLYGIDENARLIVESFTPEQQ